MRSLNKREKRFVHEYLIDLDPKRAAIAAGYSKTMAATKAYQWVSNGKVKPHVYQAVLKAFQKREKRTEITVDRVLEEYAKLAFLDPRKFYDDQGNLIDIPKLPEEVAACLSGMDVAFEKNEHGMPVQIRKIKFSDKRAALDSVAKHLGMFKDNPSDDEAPMPVKVEISVVDGRKE
jgi:phage terminase small subunit